MAASSHTIDLGAEPSLEHLPESWEQMSEVSRHGWIQSWHEQNRGQCLCPHCFAINTPQYIQQVRGKRFRFVDNACTCKSCYEVFCLNCGDKLHQRAAAAGLIGQILYHEECGRTPSWLEAQRAEVGLWEGDARVQQPPRAESEPGTSTATVPHGAATAGDGAGSSRPSKDNGDVKKGEEAGERDGRGEDTAESEAEIEAEQGETTEEEQDEPRLGEEDAVLDPAGTSEQPSAPDAEAAAEVQAASSNASGTSQPPGPSVSQREVADLTGSGSLTGGVVKEEPAGQSSGARRSHRKQAEEQSRMQELNRAIRATPTRIFVELNCGEGSLSKQVVLEPGWVAKLIDRNNVVKWTDDFQPGEKATFLQLDIDTISDERWREIAGCASWIHAAPSCTSYGWQTQGNEMRHLNPGGRGSTPEADAADEHVKKILHLLCVARDVNPETLLSLENPNATIGLTDAIKYAKRRLVFRYEDTLNYCMHDPQAPWKSSVLYHDCEPLHEEYKDGKCVCKQDAQSKQWTCGAVGKHTTTVAGMTPQEAAAYPEKVAAKWAKCFAKEAKRRSHIRAANAAAPSQWLSF